MKLIDTHAHLTFNPLVKQLADVLERAKQAGIEKIITVGTTADDSGNAIKLANEHPDIFAAVGIHPHEADKVLSADVLIPIIKSSQKIVAVGETGLDYHYNFAEKNNQQKLFESHLALALQYNLPLIIHCREAFDDVLSIIRSASDNLRGVFHCFGGSIEQAKKIIDIGWDISVTGIITFKNAVALRETIKTIGLSHILIETDCPYMSPEPIRKNRINEPANVKYIAELLSDLIDLPMEKVAEILHNNTLRVFSNLRKGIS